MLGEEPTAEPDPTPTPRTACGPGADGEIICFTAPARYPKLQYPQYGERLSRIMESADDAVRARDRGDTVEIPGALIHITLQPKTSPEPLLAYLVSNGAPHSVDVNSSWRDGLIEGVIAIYFVSPPVFDSTDHEIGAIVPAHLIVPLSERSDVRKIEDGVFIYYSHWKR